MRLFKQRAFIVFSCVACLLYLCYKFDPSHVIFASNNVTIPIYNLLSSSTQDRLHVSPEPPSVKLLDLEPPPVPPVPGKTKPLLNSTIFHTQVWFTEEEFNGGPACHWEDVVIDELRTYILVKDSSFLEIVVQELLTCCPYLDINARSPTSCPSGSSILDADLCQCTLRQHNNLVVTTQENGFKNVSESFRGNTFVMQHGAFQNSNPAHFLQPILLFMTVAAESTWFFPSTFETLISQDMPWDTSAGTGLFLLRVISKLTPKTSVVQLPSLSISSSNTTISKWVEEHWKTWSSGQFLPMCPLNYVRNVFPQTVEMCRAFDQDKWLEPAGRKVRLEHMYQYRNVFTTETFSRNSIGRLRQAFYATLFNGREPLVTGCQPLKVGIFQRVEGQFLRSFTNLDALVVLVSKILNVSRVEMLTISSKTPGMDQIKMFADLDVLLTPTGGHLGNLYFATEGAVIVELQPDLVKRHFGVHKVDHDGLSEVFFPEFYLRCVPLGFQYYVVASNKAVGEVPEGPRDWLSTDMIVNLVQVEKILKHAKAYLDRRCRPSSLLSSSLSR